MLLQFSRTVSVMIVLATVSQRKCVILQYTEMTQRNVHRTWPSVPVQAVSRDERGLSIKGRASVSPYNSTVIACSGISGEQESAEERTIQCHTLISTMSLTRRYSSRKGSINKIIVLTTMHQATGEQCCLPSEGFIAVPNWMIRTPAS